MRIKQTNEKYTEYELSKTDEKYGITDDPTTVVVRLASPSDNLSRYRILQSHFFDYESLQRIEIFLTLAGCNILNEEGEPFFKFDKAGYLTAEEFSKTWNERIPFIFDEIHECVHASNPNWAKEWEAINKIRLDFNKCMLQLSAVVLDVNSFDHEIKINFEVRVNVNGQISSFSIPPD